MHQLPLTLLERYFYHEDRRAFPCWILTRYRFRGAFDRDALQGAWERTVPRHPLLTAVIRRDWRGRLVWRRADAFKPLVEWTDRRESSGWPRWHAIDLEKSPGFHLIALESGGFTDLYAQAHHAIHDGIGSFAVMNDLLSLYCQSRGVAVRLPEAGLEGLAHRNRFGLSLAGRLRLAPSLALGLALSLQLHRRTVAPLCPHSPAPGEDDPPSAMPTVVSRRFAAEDTRRFRDAARNAGATMNDVFIRDVQAALGVWLKENGNARPSDWTRLGIPVNLRGRSHQVLPSANLIGLVIIDRSVKSLGDRDRLLRRAREDMNWVKAKKWGYVFAVLLGLCRLLPGGLRGYARRRVCRATLVLSNLGQAFAGSPICNPQGRIVVPGAVLEEVGMAVPYRAGTCASFGVGTYADSLWVDLNYDPRVLTAAQANALADAFSTQLKLSMGGTRS